MISHSTRLKYYKRPEIQEAIVNAATDREIAVRYGDGGYGKRPDTLSYPRDVLEFAKKGVTSFHCSEERWENPLLLGPKLTRRQQEDLRSGWDLVLDIDCKNIEFAKITAVLLMNALEYHGVKSTSVKFSGNNGFHLGVPFEAFPKSVNNTPTERLFPDGARKIAALLKEMIREPLAKEILKSFTLEQLKEFVKNETLIKNNKFNPYAILEIDTILISPRHLYRMPYSLHEKSGYASIPLTKEQIPNFRREDADPAKVVPSSIVFLDGKNATPDEAKKLLLQALDFKVVEDRDYGIKKKSTYEIDLEGFEVPEELFPPCIKLIFKGLEDGKKRAMFILLNFLTNVGWGYDRIEPRLNEWNKVNPDPVREVIMLGQLRHHKQNKKKMLPPNCKNKAYYADLQVCKPDSLCQRIKNPVNYATRKAWYLRQQQKIKEKVNQVNKKGQKDDKNSKEGQNKPQKEAQNKEEKTNSTPNVNQVNMTKSS